jgi:hypothetical protein
MLSLVFATVDERVAALQRDVELLKREVECLRLENQLLAELNENMRRWVRANTAAAESVAQSFGAPPTARSRPG